MAPTIELTFHGGPLDGRTERFTAERVTIGRDPRNTVVIPLATISGRHGCLSREGGAWKYEDLRSSNGTLIRHADGRESQLTGRRRAPVAIGDGDRLLCGACEIEFRLLAGAEFSRDADGELTIVHRVGLNELTESNDPAEPGSAQTLRALQQFLQRIGFAADPPEVLRDLLRFAARLNDGAERALLVDVADGAPHAALGFDRAGRELSAAELTFSRAVVQETVRLQDGLVLADAQQEFPSESLIDLQLHGVIAAPLWDGDKILSVVLVEGGKPPAVFRRSDLRMTMFFVFQASLVLAQLRLIRELNEAFLSSVKALVRSLDLRDSDTSAHSLKVQSLALEIARTMQLPPERADVVRFAALLHDVGKIAIPDEILLGKAELDERQRAIMREHARFTREILDLISFPARLCDVPRAAAGHHERLNGSGPLGWKGDEIPLEARIVAVADVFEALTARRSYKTGNRTAETLKHIRAMAGEQLDPTVVDALEKAILI